jgi:hypothetical protein
VALLFSFYNLLHFEVILTGSITQGNGRVAFYSEIVRKVSEILRIFKELSAKFNIKNENLMPSTSATQQPFI